MINKVQNWRNYLHYAKTSNVYFFVTIVDFNAQAINYVNADLILTS